uniref:Uncharacterized protein n=1 Tax=Arundo donax TaxID=35708 RepID=A0A0A9B6A2_ARUDO
MIQERSKKEMKAPKPLEPSQDLEPQT